MSGERRVIKAKVTPGASRPRVEETGDGSIRIFVRSRAEKGRANAEALKRLAAHLGVPKSELTILRGAGSREKLIQVD